MNAADLPCTTSLVLGRGPAQQASALVAQLTFFGPSYQARNLLLSLLESAVCCSQDVGLILSHSPSLWGLAGRGGCAQSAAPGIWGTAYRTASPGWQPARGQAEGSQSAENPVADGGNCVREGHQLGPAS